MPSCTARWLLAVLLCLGLPSGALAQTAEELQEEQQTHEQEVQRRIQEIRALYAKVQEASKRPAPVERKNTKAKAPWSRLRVWELKDGPDSRLRKVVINSRGASGEVERSFFLKDDTLFFALYVTTAKTGKKDEERLYYDTGGDPIRWQHNPDIRPMDGHALRWGEQGWSDSRVALGLVDGKDDTHAVFEPITCAAGNTECRDMSPGTYCVTKYDLVPPPGLPVQKEICSSSPWFAGQGTTCDFDQEDRTLTVTQHFQQSCSDNPDCESQGQTSKEISLSPEMGRVLKCPLLNR
jgi:hypothetical protein